MQKVILNWHGKSKDELMESLIKINTVIIGKYHGMREVVEENPNNEKYAGMLEAWKDIMDLLEDTHKLPRLWSRF